MGGSFGSGLWRRPAAAVLDLRETAGQSHFQHFGNFRPRFVVFLHRMTSSRGVFLGSLHPKDQKEAHSLYIFSVLFCFCISGRRIQLKDENSLTFGKEMIGKIQQRRLVVFACPTLLTSSSFCVAFQGWFALTAFVRTNGLWIIQRQFVDVSFLPFVVVVVVEGVCVCVCVCVCVYRLVQCSVPGQHNSCTTQDHRFILPAWCHFQNGIASKNNDLLRRLFSATLS